MPRTPTRSLNTVAAAAVVGTLTVLAGALGGGGAADASSPTIDTPIFCPPNIATIGTPYNPPGGLYDDDAGSYKVSLSGSLPDGLSLVTRTGLSPIVKGTPTRLGASTFTITLTDQWSKTKQKFCSIDVVPAGSIVERIGAADRYDEAVEIAYRLGTTSTPLVYVASGENFADALSASAIAGQRGAPVLLSRKDSLPADALKFITGRAPNDVVVVGSEDSVSAAVVAQITTVASGARVTRIGGADRYETSRLLIGDARVGAVPSSKMFAASGRVFPDALSASPAATTVTSPVLLVDGTAASLSLAEKALLSARAVTSVTVLGGEDTLSPGLKNDFAATTGTADRIDGADRYAVSAHAAAKFFPATPPSDVVYLATGANFPDALAGGALAGSTRSPILLVSKGCMTREVAAEITRLKPKHLVLLGGPATLDATLGTLPICS